MTSLFSRRETLAGMTALSAAASVRAANPASDVGALLDRLAWQLLELVPERATTLGVDTGPHADLRRRLEDRSPAGIAARQRFLTDGLKQVARVPRTGLDPATLTSLAVVESAFQTALDGMALPYGVATIGDWRNTPYAVIQNVGAWLDVPQMLDGDQPVRDKADAEAYLARLAAMPAQLDGETVRIRQAREQGLVPPSFLLDKTIKGMTGTIAEAAKADGPLIGPLARKTTAIPGEWTNRAAQIVRSAIVPALERQLAELQAQRGVAIAAPGMNVRPHGPEWYAWGLRAGTTTRRSAADLHAMGQARLADLQAQMDTILRSEGLTQGSVAERAIAYQKRPGIGFPDGDEGRRQIVAYMQGRIDAIRPRLPDAFRRLARGNLEIRRMPVAQEPGAPAAYGGPGTIDGSVPGKVWVNLGDPSIHNRVTIPDLVYHEGIPGHVWQGEYAQKLPLIRSILAFNAYSEGWALYSEQLADELGMYRDDPAGRLGYLMGLAWRAVRLIVDTGIHAIGWSRDKALAEFIAATGLPRSNAESEVDRYCSWPGQACGYEVGRAEIVSQRTRAQKALGTRYDLRDFDQAVVDGGNVPLNVLAENVTHYIDGVR
ncbi:DUF885 domain-containing protein [Sphingomonas sp. Leaf257]|jgi:uncharacterized protein (DUF885 family)|uniref:DUF885 domain-containing protein n=1 Tax=Sphingomonas sp. Leaf257 TaxID=1736309 RepID=UPI0009E68C2E|nr:DUF885 domain-containing protein [Sphingomonas sp. Leaf257]